MLVRGGCEAGRHGVRVGDILGIRRAGRGVQDPESGERSARKQVGNPLAHRWRREPESYAGATRRRRRALDSLLHLSRTARAGRGAAGWTRDELRER